MRIIAGGMFTIAGAIMVGGGRHSHTFMAAGRGCSRSPGRRLPHRRWNALHYRDERAGKSTMMGLHAIRTSYAVIDWLSRRESAAARGARYIRPHSEKLRPVDLATT